MPPTWQLSVWITSLAGKYELLDGVMGMLASNYFSPALMALICLCLWFGTRDAAQRERSQKTLIHVCVGVLLAFLIVVILNAAQSERGNLWERPYINHSEAEKAMNILYWPLSDSSFPSNAITGLAAAAAGLWSTNKRASLIAWGLVGLWGLGRVYVGIHYPIDIAGGILIGSVSAFVGLKLMQTIDSVPSSLLRLARRLLLA